MARKLRKTFSGRQEEVWATKNDGLFGAYDLKEWYLALPNNIKTRILNLHREAEAKSGMMMKWKESELISGPMEIHRPILEQWQWQYSSVPALLRELFELTNKRDEEIAKLVLAEWLSRAKKSRSAGARYLALTAAVEFHWSRGYINAKDVREHGINNADLELVEKYGLEILDLLEKKQLPADLPECKPLDRLCLLYKLLCKNDTIDNLRKSIAEAGYTKI